MKDIVVSFTRWTCPDVALGISVSKHAKQETENEECHLQISYREVGGGWALQVYPFIDNGQNKQTYPSFLTYSKYPMRISWYTAVRRMRGLKK